MPAQGRKSLLSGTSPAWLRTKGRRRRESVRERAPADGGTDGEQHQDRGQTGEGGAQLDVLVLELHVPGQVAEDVLQLVGAAGGEIRAAGGGGHLAQGRLVGAEESAPAAGSEPAASATAEVLEAAAAKLFGRADHACRVARPE